MNLVWVVAYYVVFAFFVLLCVRVVLSLIQSFSPQWKPQGFMLVVFEAVFTATDPPLKAVGRVLPPLRVGTLMIDLAFLVVMIVTVLAMNVFQALALSA